jgi:hypothetical protein
MKRMNGRVLQFDQPDVVRIPRGSFADVAVACDAWLRRKGVHHFMSLRQQIDSQGNWKKKEGPKS